MPVRRGLGFALATGTFLVAAAAHARITQVQITAKESPTFGGFSWPGVGQYEKIVGKAFGEVDPHDAKNSGIVDIGLAPQNARGNVEYPFDFYILKPIDLKKGAHRVMYEPPNRGRKTWETLGRVTQGNDPGSITDPAVLANAFLMPRGYTMVWSGWDASATAGATNIVLPGAENPGGSTTTRPPHEDIVKGGAPLAPAHPAASLDTTQAKLTHRVHLDDTPVALAPTEWKYNTTGTAISLVGKNFSANDIYELSYTAKDPTVNGLGFAAVRDWNAWLRYEDHD